MNQLFCFLCGVSNYNINLGELSPLLNYHMIFVYVPDDGIVNIYLCAMNLSHCFPSL